LLLQKLPYCKKISIKTYFIEPATELERKVHELWCLVLQEEEQISMSANFFSLGGNSHLLLKLCYLYQTELLIDHHTDFVKFYKQPTLREHAQLVKSLKGNNASTKTM
jgi:aryl carrier-like protein